MAPQFREEVSDALYKEWVYPKIWKFEVSMRKLRETSYFVHPFSTEWNSLKIGIKVNDFRYFVPFHWIWRALDSKDAQGRAVALPKP